MNSVYIPSLTDNGTILKLEGYGFPHINKKHKAGDLYIKLFLKTPYLTQEVIDAILLASNQ